MEDDDEIDAMTLTPQIPFKPKTMITINVKMLHDRTYPLSVDDEVALPPLPSITVRYPRGQPSSPWSWPQIVVASLKAEIAAVTETPVNRQRLIFQGKVLKDEDKISAYGAALGSLADARTS